MPSQETIAREDRALNALLLVLKEDTGHQGVIIDNPDRNGVIGGCEAIISLGQRTLAVEHTSLDTFKNQRQDNERFLKVMAPLEPRISNAFPKYAITLTIHCNSIQPGSKWDEVEEAIFQECLKQIPTLKSGEHKDVQSASMPIPVTVSRDPDEFGPGCYTSRYSPQKELVKIIKMAFSKKRAKMSRYQSEGKTSVLLLDGDDFSLTTDKILADAFLDATHGEDISMFDWIYLVDSRTTRKGLLVLPLKYNGMIYPNTEYEKQRRKQCLFF